MAFLPSSAFETAAATRNSNSGSVADFTIDAFAFVVAAHAPVPYGAANLRHLASASSFFLLMAGGDRSLEGSHIGIVGTLDWRAGRLGRGGSDSAKLGRTGTGARTRCALSTSRSFETALGAPRQVDSASIIMTRSQFARLNLLPQILQISRIQTWQDASTPFFWGLEVDASGCL